MSRGLGLRVFQLIDELPPLCCFRSDLGCIDVNEHHYRGQLATSKIGLILIRQFF